MIYETHYTDRDRDPRPKTKPCHFCARDVEAGMTCFCVPAQPRSVPLTYRKAGFNLNMGQPYGR